MSNLTPGRGVRGRIKQEIMYDLGYPVVRVEVIEPWVDSAIDRALREFSRITPQAEVWESFPTQAGVHRYLVPDDYVAIRECVYTPSNWGLFYYDMFPGWGAWYDWLRSYSSMTDYTISDMYINMSERVFGKQATWEFHHPYIYLYPMPRQSGPVWIKVQKVITEDAIREEDWVREYALAVVKQRLGRVRGKYQSLPGPRGDISLDGADLISDSKETILRLVDDLRAEYQEPLGFYTG